MIEDCTAVILAGGNSTRMGEDKAALQLDGVSLLQAVIDVVEPLFARTLVSVRERREGLKLPQICDAEPGLGPLAGVVSALENIDTPWAFVAACDMPFIAPEIVVRLAQMRGDFQAVVPVVQGFRQPLLAFYRRDALPVFRDNLLAGDRSFTRALEKLNVRFIGQDELMATDPALESFIDLDTPEDFTHAIGLLK